ncbi:hypothetical protein KUTeg_013714 [Tegillarca granosa]|uniref:Uncharacterized protein n=1 Tax=Tegillarca granosa TaxID=220873 RepID=A0ABQ9EUI9_TEGGR|nr:hypothetical protein KUTeg_013714 [Tegillarca granosa]
MHHNVIRITNTVVEIIPNFLLDMFMKDYCRLQLHVCSFSSSRLQYYSIQSFHANMRSFNLKLHHMFKNGKKKGKSEKCTIYTAQYPKYN